MVNRDHLPKGHLMGLKWVRVDNALPRNHKINELISMRDGYRSGFVYVCLLAYCGEQESDGFIPRSALPFCHARAVDMSRLVQVRLVEVDPDGGGWNIPDWREYQPTSDEIAAKSKRMKHAARVRWERERAKHGKTRDDPT
jgi:hypothetical protein